MRILFKSIPVFLVVSAECVLFRNRNVIISLKNCSFLFSPPPLVFHTFKIKYISVNL